MTHPIPKEDRVWSKDDLKKIGIEIKIKEEYRNLVFPLSQADEKGLKESIKQNGQWEQIIINEQGVILDGHNRYDILIQLDHAPKFQVKSFPDELHEKLFVIDSNLKRRHLNIFQKIGLLSVKKLILEEVAKKNMSLGGKGVKNLTPLGRVDKIIGDEAGVSYETVRKFAIVNQKASSIQREQLLKGNKKIHAVFDEIYKEEKKQKQIETMKEHAQNLDQKSLKELAERFQLIHGDALIECQKIPDNSIALIFTDPPYLEKDLYLYRELRKIAVRVLKPGGSLVTYAPHIHLDKIFQYIVGDDQLKYYWIICNKQEVVTQTYGRRVLIHWKPLLWCVLGKLNDQVIRPMHDLIESKMPDKTTFKWTQSPVEAEEIIKNLTFLEDDTVLDLFMGEGTTGIACIRQQRKFIGIEIDKHRHAIADLKIKEALLEFKQQQEA